MWRQSLVFRVGFKSWFDLLNPSPNPNQAGIGFGFGIEYFFFLCGFGFDLNLNVIFTGRFGIGIGFECDWFRFGIGFECKDLELNIKKSTFSICLIITVVFRSISCVWLGQ